MDKQTKCEQTQCEQTKDRQLTAKEIKNAERHAKVLQAYVQCNSKTKDLAPLIENIFKYMKESNVHNQEKSNSRLQAYIELINSFEIFRRKS